MVLWAGGCVHGRVFDGIAMYLPERLHPSCHTLTNPRYYHLKRVLVGFDG